MGGSNATDAVPTLDERLLFGLGFACRPDCGLCCYAEPRVSGSEKRQLLQIVPEAEFLGHGADEFLASHPEGGACQMLSANRCRAHHARPHPCREFPLTAHVGHRLQATVVLSCPGVDLGGLVGFRAGVAGGTASGFPEELASLRTRVDRSAGRRLEASARRRRKLVRALDSEGRWVEEEATRAALRDAVPFPSDDDFPSISPPSVEDGQELLPLFFDGRTAPVALAAGMGGWELHELRSRGGFARSLGVVPPPDRCPRMTPEAEAVLQGYLRYFLERDALFGSVHLRMLEASDGTVTEWVRDELRSIGALVLSRAEVRAKLSRGEAERLSTADVQNGIRATDQDLLDRSTWGDRF